MRFVTATFLGVLGILLVAASLVDEGYDWHDSFSPFSGVGMITVGCREPEHLEELIGLGLAQKSAFVLRRMSELENIKDEQGRPACQHVEFRGDERLTPFKKYPMTQVFRNQLAIVEVVLMRRPDGTVLYVELIRYLGQGYAI